MDLRALTKRHLIIAHRGYRARYPENTLCAFTAALDAGADMIELDVMLSRDRKVVVIHDATLERTTNGKGLVMDHTVEQLKRLDAGSWFDPRFAGETLPTLEEVLEHVGDRALINVEIKAGAYESHRPADAIEEQVVELVKQGNLDGSVLISSFEPRILENIAGMNHAPAIGLLSRHGAGDAPVSFCLKLVTYSWHPNCLDLGEERVKRAQEAGVRVFPYNVETPEDCGRMIRMGVDGVITGDPLMAMKMNPAPG